MSMTQQLLKKGIFLAFEAHIDILGFHSVCMSKWQDFRKYSYRYTPIDFWQSALLC